MKDEQLVRNYLDDVKRIADSFPMKDVIEAVAILYEVFLQGGIVYLCGNGGSASTASHFANDLLKVGLSVNCLDDNLSMITAITNDSGFSKLYTEQIEKRITKYDALIVLSVHGGLGQDKAGVWSTNLTNAVEYAKIKGAKTIGLLGYDGGAIKHLTTVSIIVGDSTPQVESWHLHIEHLICLLLKEKIK